MQNWTLSPRAMLTFVALAVVMVSDPLCAQIVGDRVRLVTADTTIVGQVTGLSDEGLEFANDEMHRSFAYRDLDRLELSNGIRSRWAQGAAIGLAGGMVVGLTQGDLPDSDLGAVLCFVGGWLLVPTYCLGDFLRQALIGLAIGGVAGAGVGTLIKYESWESVLLRDDVVPLPGDGERVRVSVDGNRVIGQATAVTDEGFEFVQGELRRSFAYRDIDGLERSVGMRSRWVWGLGIGFVGGGVARAASGGEFRCIVSCDDDELETQIFVWSLAGGAVGAGLGALMKRESWESVLLRDGTVSLSPIVAPQLGPDGRQSLLLGVRLEF